MPLSRVGFPNLPTRSAPIDVSAAFRLSGISRRPRGFWHLGSRRGFPALRWRSPQATVPLACSRRAAVRLRRQQSERFAFCGSPSLIGSRSGSPKPSPSRPRRAQGLRPSHPRDVIACSLSDACAALSLADLALRRRRNRPLGLPDGVSSGFDIVNAECHR
jgi:hypothetical protein